MMAMRTRILVRGIVQGVGFRPYIYSLARRRALKGSVFNDTAGVVIDIEGEDRDVERFVKEIRLNPPPLSRIETVERADNLVPANYREFVIGQSTGTGARFVPIAPDVATCEDCLKELSDPNGRRYRYAFINCTNCGPRFTIIEGVPYDRARTTMREFPMCDACRAEYEDPLDRRFHAEPIACPDCGPRLRLVNSQGLEFAPGLSEDAIDSARWLVLNGRIVAVKGLGGFHLACDATNAEAVARLRNRKHREQKPFALMAASVDFIREFCFVSEAEEVLLHSRRRPIVLLAKRPESGIPAVVAPGVNTLGFMLPYTPLHHLMLQELDRPLVMTSGNISDEPICYEDGEAEQRLGGIADAFLLHGRRIKMRTDDSVTRVRNGAEVTLRRSRGYAPTPIKTSFKFTRQILACGAELKNTFCLTRDDCAFVSHHIGDLENLETLCSFTEGIEHFKHLFDLHPEVVAYDLHPEYLSTKYAMGLDEIETSIGVQHHHAHIASCLADNGVDGEVIGVAMDGLGFGEDGRLWGGEFFVADFANAERVAHLEYVPMPGGAKAIREPWRMAAVYLHRALGDEFLELDLPFVNGLNRRAWATLARMASTGLNSPQTSSMGRLFDAVSSLLGLRNTANYEGQAAIELEAIAGGCAEDGYQFDIDDGIIRADRVIRQAVDDLLNGRGAAEVSARFHNAVAQLIARVSNRVRAERHLNRVALSGGVFQNELLVGRTCRMLTANGFHVFTHGRVPANDGGISLGQAAIANARLARAKR
jgi:hydrogenase maturation protein HypF